MMHLYNTTCAECSKLVTQKYSTSFTLGIKAFDKELQDPIYNIYGFVRLADEIVDTFHAHDKQVLLNEFTVATYTAIERKISTNPILQAFQQVVHDYHIERDLIAAFLKSMEMDLYDIDYDKATYDEYIYGSAEVVGLMCLRVFCKGNEAQYQSLKASAKRLGAAFQKVNFLRDMKSDYEERGRVYFPGVNYAAFNDVDKKAIEDDIKADFEAAYEGIMRLPSGAMFGVYTAYKYYKKLFDKIVHTSADEVLQKRIRVPNQQKIAILLKSMVRHQFNLL